MTEETARELHLTSYVSAYGPPPRYVNPCFYDNLRKEDDPPIYTQVLNEFTARNKEDEDKTEDKREEGN